MIRRLEYLVPSGVQYPDDPKKAKEIKLFQTSRYWDFMTIISGPCRIISKITISGE